MIPRVVTGLVCVSCRANFPNDDHVTQIVTLHNTRITLRHTYRVMSCHDVSGHSVTFLHSYLHVCLEFLDYVRDCQTSRKSLEKSPPLQRRVI